MTAKRPPPDLRLVGAAIGGAADPPIDEPPGEEEKPPRTMPPGCPVTPLGTCDNIFYYLTTLGELRGLKAQDLGNKNIVGMFAPLENYLYDTWPAKKQIIVLGDDDKPMTDAAGDKVKEWIVTGWKTAVVSDLLMGVAASRGVWNLRERVRGRGAHRDTSGRLILHCGDHVLAGGAWQKPGVIGAFVYPSAPAIPRPGELGQSFAIVDEAGEREVPIGLALLHWLKCWNWARPLIDPMLALGFVAIARLGGAIEWRPLQWITGGAGEGKSTLMAFIGDLFDGGMLKLEAASEAAVRQLLGQDTLPVVLDESESEEDDRQMAAILKLARIAASGGNVGKGGQDHQGVQFTARSCFLFSSILIPPLLPADKSRIAVLELRRLPAGSREPRIVKHDREEERKAMCAAISRRMVDHWHRWPATFEAFSDALIDMGGHRGRGAKVFATLLAAAHIMLDDDPPREEELAGWGQSLHVDSLAELADSDGDDKRVIQYLATCPVQLAGPGNNRLVVEWVHDAHAGQARDESDEEYKLRKKRAHDALARIGIAIVVGVKRDKAAGAKPQPLEGRTYLAIATTHQGLGKLFVESGWKGRAGASGVWSQSLKRIEGAIYNERRRIAGIIVACTLVPIEAMFGDDPSAGDGQKKAPADAGAEVVDA